MVTLIKNPRLHRPSPRPCSRYPHRQSSQLLPVFVIIAPPSSSLRLHRPRLCLRPLCLHLLPTTSPQLLLPSLLLQSRHPSLAPSFTHLAQLPVSSLVLTPPPLPCPFEYPLYHCTTDDPTHPLLLLSPCSTLSLRVGWPTGNPWEVHKEQTHVGTLFGGIHCDPLVTPMHR